MGREEEQVQGYASVLQVLLADELGGKRAPRTEGELQWLFPSLNRNDITDAMSELQLLKQRRPIQPWRSGGKQGERNAKIPY